MTAGITCTISQSTNATRSISLSLGITRGTVASGLGISASSDVGTSVSCTSPALSAGQSFRAYPLGTRFSYKAQKKTIVGPQTTTEVSGTLYAFDPRANAVACKVV